MNKSLFLTIAIMLCCFPLFAQQEQWDTYMTQLGAKPASVLVDMGLYPAAPVKLFPYLVVTGPRAKKCDAYGLPPAPEIGSLEQVLSATSGMLSGATAKKLVGTLTYNCERLNYYYVQDTTAVRRALNRMYENHLSDYTFSLKIKYDPHWEVYRGFLYPDSAARAWMASNKTISAMTAAGDDLRQPRDITYTFFFLSESNRSVFAEAASKHNYTIAGKTVSQGMSALYEVSLSRHGMVRMDSVLANQAELEQLAAPLKGNFKGWRADAKLPAGK